MQCEYFALEGLSCAGGHHQGAQGQAQPGAGDRRHRAHHVRRAQQPRQRRVGRIDQALRRQGVPHRSSRATCAWPRRPATARASSGYDRASRGGIAYLGLAGEIVRREKKLKEISMSDQETRPRPRPGGPAGHGQQGRGAEPRNRRSRPRACACLPIRPCSRASTSRAPAWTRPSSPSWPSRSSAQGLIQPIVVREIGAGKDGQPRYEIIAGERRWRAATQAGLTRRAGGAARGATTAP